MLVVGREVSEIPNDDLAPSANILQTDVAIPKTEDGLPDYESLMHMGEEGSDSDDVEILGASMDGIVCSAGASVLVDSEVCAAGASVLVDSESDGESEGIQPISALKSGQKRAALLARATAPRKIPKEKKTSP